MSKSLHPDQVLRYFKGLEEVHNELLGSGSEGIMLGASSHI
jgi:hypothetical protein